MEKSLLHEDNQQESIKTLRELSWLGGIFDGEGCITLRYHARKNSTPFITCVLTITNTDRIMIDEIDRIYKKYNIPHYISYRKGTDTWSESWEIDVTGLKRCAKVIPLVKDYIICKQAQLENVETWINYRLSKLGRHQEYTEYDLEFVTRAREFNKKGNKTSLLSSETTR